MRLDVDFSKKNKTAEPLPTTSPVRTMTAAHGAQRPECSGSPGQTQKGGINVMTTGKETDMALAKQLIAGTKQHFSTVSSLTFGNGTFTPAQVEAFLQTLIDLRTAVNDAKSDAKAKIVAEAAQAASLRSQMAAFVTFVKATFGNSPDALADFGLKPKKTRASLTIGQLAEAAARRAATRAARHTMGPKQKQHVKGTITTIVTPPAAPAPAPVTPSPVVSAPSTGTSAGTAPHVA
jgi:hypothetical protein